MGAQTRFARALDRIAVGTRVIGMRDYDSERAQRNGKHRDEGLEKAAAKLEAAADELWAVIGK